MVSKTANSHLNPPPRPTGAKGLHRSSGVVTPLPDTAARPQAKPQPRQRVKPAKPEGPLKKAARKSAGEGATPSSSALRRAAHKQALEQRLLDAARALFAERGQEAVTLREVAAAVGYSHAMIYSFFADKRALLARLGEEGSRGLADSLRAEGAALHGVVGAYLRWAAAHPHHYRLLTGDGAESGKIYALLRTVVEALPGAPAAAAETDVRTQTLWAALHGAALLELDPARQGAGPWRPLDERIAALAGWLERV